MWQFTAEFKDSQDVTISFDKVSCQDYHGRQWLRSFIHPHIDKLIDSSINHNDRRWEMQLFALHTPSNLLRSSLFIVPVYF